MNNKVKNRLSCPKCYLNPCVCGFQSEDLISIQSPSQVPLKCEQRIKFFERECPGIH